ncbi:MAG TPA: hypothetical protein VLB76_25440 [Thermoanaerobaculia bacterium]|nr:hypothetical protein [Thermoanaerobaculia bacterium]
MSAASAFPFCLALLLLFGAHSTAPAGRPRPPLVFNPVREWYGWELYLEAPDPDVRYEILVRDEVSAPEWYRHDLRRPVDPRLLTPGRHRIEARIAGPKGKISSPQIFWFDPVETILRAAKHQVDQSVARWASFYEDSDRGFTWLSFTTALDVRDVLREVRYSLDGCALDRRFPFKPWTDLEQAPKSVDGEKNYTEIPKTTASVCVQLVYLDGTTTEPQTFFPHPERVAPTPPWKEIEAGQAPAPVAAARPSPVAFRTQRSEGWDLFLGVAEPQAWREIRWRFVPDPWRSTGFEPRIDPRTGRRTPVTRVSVPQAKITPGPHEVEVQLVDLEGRKTGPYPFLFYPEREILEQTKRAFGAPDAQWASFAAKLYGDKAVLYVMGLQLIRDALREIRYSIDSCDLDQRLPFRKWDDLLHSPRVSEGEILFLPADVACVCFQLVYRDGEVTEPRRVERVKGGRCAVR